MKLIIKDDSGKNTPVQLTRDEITVGRKEGNTIQLTEKNVSRTHARFLRKGDEITIEDLSRYGTRVNGERITSRRVGAGDLIVIGDYVLTLEGVPPVVLEDAPLPGTAAAVVSAMSGKKKAEVDAAARAHLAAAKADLFEGGPPGLPPSLPGGSSEERKSRGEGKKRIGAVQPTLVAVTTHLAGTEFPIKGDMVTIGRTGESTMVIDHHSISRNHAKIVVKDDQVRMMDLQSKNGIRVNGEYWEESVLKSGDIIELGKVQFRFVEAGEEFVYRPSEYSEDAIGTTLIDVEEKKSGKGGTIFLVLIALILAGLIYYFVDSNKKATDLNMVSAPIKPATVAGAEVAKDAPPAEGKAGEPVAAAEVAKPAEPEKPKALTPEQQKALGDQFAAAQTAVTAQKWGDAVKALDAVDALQPNHTEAAALRAKVTSEQRAQKGLEEAKAAYGSKKYDDAWELLKSLESVPVDSAYTKDINTLRGNVATNLAQKHIVASEKAIKDREWDTAISEAEAARGYVANHKNVPDLIEKAQRGKYQQARRQLEREMEAQKKAGNSSAAAAANKPKDATSNKSATELYTEARALHHSDPDRALQLYQQAAGKGHAMAYRMIGTLKAAKYDRRGALEAYKKYLELNPNGTDAEMIRKLIEDLSK